MFFICLDSIAFSFSVIGYWSQSLNSNDKISENSLNYDHFLEWLTALIVFSVRKSSFVPWFRAHWRSKDVCTSFEKIIQRRQWIIPECHSFYCDAHKYCLIFIKICIQWFSGMLSSFPMTIFFFRIRLMALYYKNSGSLYSLRFLVRVYLCKYRF